MHYSKIKAALEQAGMLIVPNDLLIAATSLAINAALVTNNTDEFSRVKELRLENWV
jgi:tRNA(fMet)-specific endonuclease VapC